MAVVVGVAEPNRRVFVQAALNGVEGPDWLRAEAVDAAFGDAVARAGHERDEAVQVVVDVDRPRRPVPGCAAVTRPEGHQIVHLAVLAAVMAAAFGDGEGVGGKHQEIVAARRLDSPGLEQGAPLGAVDDLAVDRRRGDQPEVLSNDKRVRWRGDGDRDVVQPNRFRQALRRVARTHRAPALERRLRKPIRVETSRSVEPESEFDSTGLDIGQILAVP